MSFRRLCTSSRILAAAAGVFTTYQVQSYYTASLCTPNPESETVAAYNREHFPNGLNHNFKNWEKERLVSFAYEKFENPEYRDICRNKLDILFCLGSLRNLRVIDVGAGSGLVLNELCQLVGPDGHVFATEISPGFISHLQNKVKENKLTNAEVVPCTEKSCGLKSINCADVALMIDVYHHFEYPLTYLRDLHSRIAPGGRLVLVDFHLDPKRVRPHTPEWVLGHIRAGQEVFRKEIESCGFRYVYDTTIPDLTENYIMVFECVKDKNTS